MRTGPSPRPGGELHAVPGGPGRAHQGPGQEPPGAGGEQRARLASGHRRQPRPPRGVLAHARVGQELLDDLLRPEGAAEGVGKVLVRGGHRPPRPRRPDLQELRLHRGGDRTSRRRAGSTGDLGSPPAGATARRPPLRVHPHP